ncbi:hypothetical protein V6615_15300 [Oscillospiraceae bacterium PP1C4]
MSKIIQIYTKEDLEKAFSKMNPNPACIGDVLVFPNSTELKTDPNNPVSSTDQNKIVIRKSETKR